MVQFNLYKVNILLENRISELLATLKKTFGNPLAFFTVIGGKNYMPYSVRVLFICEKCF
jgi:hypothetical protein